MEYDQIPKRIIGFQKLSFNNWYNAVTLLQEQTASTVNLMLNQAAWIPEEGRNAIQDWMDIYRDERNRFKSYIDSGFATLEKSVRETRKPAKKAEQPAHQG